MFCPNCGEKNPEENKFCMFCGAELIDNQNFPDSINIQSAREAADILWKSIVSLCKKTGGFLKRHKAATAVVTVAVVAAIALNSVFNAMFSPKSVVDRYFTGLMAGDAEKVYACLDIPSSPFTGLDSFRNYLAANSQLSSLYNYEIVEQKSSSYSYSDSSDPSGLSRTYRVNYYLRGSSDQLSTQVTLVKSAQKKYFLFDDYRVLPDFLCVDYSIVAPAGSTVTLEGVALSDATALENGTELYTVPALFYADYDITVQNPLCADYYDSLYPRDGSSYACSGLAYNEATRSEVYALASGQVNSILIAALARQDLPGDIAVTSDTEAASGIAQSYADLQNRMYDTSNNTGYLSLSILSQSDNSDNQYLQSGETIYSCETSFAYHYSYQRRGWASDEISVEDGDDNGYAYLTYRYEDGAWKLYRLSIDL